MLQLPTLWKRLTTMGRAISVSACQILAPGHPAGPGGKGNTGAPVTGANVPALSGIAPYDAAATAATPSDLKSPLTYNTIVRSRRVSGGSPRYQLAQEAPDPCHPPLLPATFTVPIDPYYGGGQICEGTRTFLLGLHRR